jgi:hypothetical protein
MIKKKIYETSFVETEFIAVTAYQNEEVNFFFIEFLSLRFVSGEIIENTIQSIC